MCAKSVCQVNTPANVRALLNLILGSKYFIETVYGSMIELLYITDLFLVKTNFCIHCTPSLWSN